MKSKKRIFIFASCCLMDYAQAHADDFILNTPRITAGEKTIEEDFTYGAGHGRQQNGYFEQHSGINYSVSDQWQTALFGEFEREPDDQPFATHIEWEIPGYRLNRDRIG